MNTVNKNIFANYLGKLWNFVSIFIFIRIYINILGIEAYAIINFYSVILGILAFADSGLTTTLNRELAKKDSLQHKADLVFTIEKIYTIICVLVITIIVLLSDFISHNFLNSALYKKEEISYLIKLIGIGVGFQLFSSLYEGGLMGLQKQILTNKVKVLWSLFRSGIVILPLLFLPSLKIYFYWQILSNLILLIILKKLLWKEIKTENKPIFSKLILRSIWKFALGMMVISFISAINIQIDKLVTSKLLPLETFGYYSLATTISQIPLFVAIPIILAIFPIFSELVSSKNIEKKIIEFHKYSYIINCITTPIIMCLFLYTIPVVIFWTGNPTIANSINLTIKILLVGGFFLCQQLMPFYIALANGHTKTNIVTGIFGLILIIPLIFYGVGKYGLIGAATPWLLLNFFSFVAIGIYIINKFLKNQYLKWLTFDITIPSIVCICIAFVIYFSTQNLKGDYWFIFEMGIIFIFSIFVNILIYNKLNPKEKLIDFKNIKI